MANQFIDLDSISALHRFYGIGKPSHPLLSLIDLQHVHRPILSPAVLYRLGFYSIYYKHSSGQLTYGKSNYEFEEGTLLFTAPTQVIAPALDSEAAQGWGLFFHPDLLNRTSLGRKMGAYTFFYYEANEALHVSVDEQQLISACVENIHREYTQNIDKHTNTLILSNLELLLNYCWRFYDRQFYTRAPVSKDIVQRFDQLLNDYFSQDRLNAGLPDVKYFASQLTLSPNYLSDVLKLHTGKTTQEHIHLKLVERAKSLLWSTEQSVSEIAYGLGFEHPSHFTKLFKTKTGSTPLAYRQPR